MSDELEQIDRGLEDGLSMADKVRRLMASHEAEDLYRLGELQLVKTAGEMAGAGHYFAALREKVSGGFKKFFEGRKVEYEHALYYIHVAEIVDQHPKFANLKSSRALRQLISLTKPNRALIEERIAEVPMEEINQFARGEISRLHSETTKRKTQVGTRGKASALDLLNKWAKEIDERHLKILDLDLSELEEEELTPCWDTLYANGDRARWHVKYPHGDVPYPLSEDPRLPMVWHESEPDDGPVECPIYDISHLKAREVRPVPFSKK